MNERNEWRSINIAQILFLLVKRTYMQTAQMKSKPNLHLFTITNHNIFKPWRHDKEDRNGCKLILNVIDLSIAVAWSCSTQATGTKLQSIPPWSIWKAELAQRFKDSTRLTGRGTFVCVYFCFRWYRDRGLKTERYQAFDKIAEKRTERKISFHNQEKGTTQVTRRVCSQFWRSFFPRTKITLF